MLGAIEVRRIFPGITDDVAAAECAQIIAGWQPLETRRVPLLAKVRPRRRTTVDRRRATGAESARIPERPQQCGPSPN
jgi:hypothetical protein